MMRQVLYCALQYPLMRKQSEQFGEWSSSSPEEETNIYATLSQNIRKYQLFHHQDLQSQKSYRIIKPNTTARHPITTNLVSPLTQANKQNKPLQDCYLNTELTYRNPKFTTLNADRSRQCTRFSRQSNQHKQELKPLKIREVKFEHKNRKKAKDRWVDIFTQLRGHKKISLKQMDNINKQTKQQKIQLFLKLLKR